MSKRRIFNKLWVIQKCDETHSRAFDTFSLTDPQSNRDQSLIGCIYFSFCTMKARVAKDIPRTTSSRMFGPPRLA